MNGDRFFYLLCMFLFLVFMIGCSSVTEEDSPIIIKEIKVDEVSDSVAPKDTFTQVNIELNAVMDKLSTKQDLIYNWYVEYLNLDLDFNMGYENDSNENSTDINLKHKSNSSYFFSNTNEANPSHHLLFIYKDGYYKVTLTVTNLVEKKSETKIIKVGEPILPKLSLSFNIPYSKKLKSTNFVGNFMISYSEKNKSNRKDMKVNASDINVGWFVTDLLIDPFKSFDLSVSSYIVKDVTNPLKPITSVEQKEINNIYFSSHYSGLNNDSVEKLFSREITFDLDPKKIATFQIYKDKNYIWEEGKLFFSILTWGYNKEEKDLFESFNGSITENSQVYKINLSNKYFVKTFFGNIGHKSVANDYYIYFGVDGLKTDEFDTNKTRSLIGVPYGYLLGKLGNDGKVFPIGYNYSYSYLETIPFHYIKRSVFNSNKEKDVLKNSTSSTIASDNTSISEDSSDKIDDILENKKENYSENSDVDNP